MSFFPYISTEDLVSTITSGELPILREVAIDFKTGIPIVENKGFKIVEGVEALKVWVYKAIKIDRFQYQIYSWNYGSEVSYLMGMGYTPSLISSELKRYIEEAILINPLIKDIEVSEMNFSEGVLEATVKVNTVFGQVEVNI